MNIKQITPFVLIVAFVLASCSTVRVSSDYDTKLDFNSYKTYAFYKKGIDKAEISDLDKRRILNAIELELESKGLKKSKNPDFLVSIFTKSRKKVSVNSDYGFGSMFWFPRYYGFNQFSVTQYSEGTLFIDFIDTKAKQLIWQGIGTGALKAKTGPKKVEKINRFVKEILTKYPPVE